MACVLGYLRHQGISSPHLTEVVANRTGFAPALTAWYLFLEGEYEAEYVRGCRIATIVGDSVGAVLRARDGRTRARSAA
jgi:hypothetical protein